jgi:hypothetical protein
MCSKSHPRTRRHLQLQSAQIMRLRPGVGLPCYRQFGRDLCESDRIHFDDVSIIPVRGQEMMIRRERKTERAIELSALRHRKTKMHRVVKEERSGNCGDSISQSVSDIQDAGGIIERETCRASDQGSKVGAFREASGDDRAVEQLRCLAGKIRDQQADNRPAIHRQWHRLLPQCR